MGKSLARSHLLLLPLVLLVMVLLEELVTVEVRSRVQSLPLRVAVLLVLYGAGFGVAAGVVAPWLKRLLVGVRRDSRALLGSWGFYVVAYGALYCAYYLWEAWGTAAAPPSELVLRLFR